MFAAFISPSPQTAWANWSKGPVVDSMPHRSRCQRRADGFASSLDFLYSTYSNCPPGLGGETDFDLFKSIRPCMIRVEGFSISNTINRGHSFMWKFWWKSSLGIKMLDVAIRCIILEWFYYSEFGFTTRVQLGNLENKD